MSDNLQPIQQTPHEHVGSLLKTHLASQAAPPVSSADWKARQDANRNSHKQVESAIKTHFGEHVSEDDAAKILGHAGLDPDWDSLILAQDLSMKHGGKYGGMIPANALILGARHHAYENDLEGRRKEAIQAAGDAKVVKLAKEGSNAHYVVHPAVQPGYQGKWQITRFDERGPSGHQVHDTRDDAIASAIGAHPKGHLYNEGDSGYKVVDKRSSIYSEDGSLERYCAMQEAWDSTVEKYTQHRPLFEGARTTTPRGAPSVIPNKKKFKAPKVKVAPTQQELFPEVAGTRMAKRKPYEEELHPREVGSPGVTHGPAGQFARKKPVSKSTATQLSFLKDEPDRSAAGEMPQNETKIDPVTMPRGVLHRMHLHLSSKGHQTRGAEDVRHTIKHGTVFKDGKFVHPDWKEAHEKAVAAIPKKEVQSELYSAMWEAWNGPERYSQHTLRKPTKLEVPSDPKAFKAYTEKQGKLPQVSKPPHPAVNLAHPHVPGGGVDEQGKPTGGRMAPKGKVQQYAGQGMLFDVGTPQKPTTKRVASKPAQQQPSSTTTQKPIDFESLPKQEKPVEVTVETPKKPAEVTPVPVPVEEVKAEPTGDAALAELHRKGDKTAFNQLLERHGGLIGKLGQGYKKKPGIDPEEVDQIGRIGLHEAASTYDPSKGASFGTHAYRVISGNLANEFSKRGRRSQRPLPQSEPIEGEEGKEVDPISQIEQPKEEEGQDIKHRDVAEIRGAVHKMAQGLEQQGTLFGDVDDDSNRKLRKMAKLLMLKYGIQHDKYNPSGSRLTDEQIGQKFGGLSKVRIGQILDRAHDELGKYFDPKYRKEQFSSDAPISDTPKQSGDKTRHNQMVKDWQETFGGFINRDLTEQPQPRKHDFKVRSLHAPTEGMRDRLTKEIQSRGYDVEHEPHRKGGWWVHVFKPKGKKVAVPPTPPSRSELKYKPVPKEQSGNWFADSSLGLYRAMQDAWNSVEKYAEGEAPEVKPITDKSGNVHKPAPGPIKPIEPKTLPKYYKSPEHEALGVHTFTHPSMTPQEHESMRQHHVSQVKNPIHARTPAEHAHVEYAKHHWEQANKKRASQPSPVEAPTAKPESAKPQSSQVETPKAAEEHVKAEVVHEAPTHAKPFKMDEGKPGEFHVIRVGNKWAARRPTGQWVEIPQGPDSENLDRLHREGHIVAGGRMNREQPQQPAKTEEPKTEATKPPKGQLFDKGEQVSPDTLLENAQNSEEKLGEHYNEAAARNAATKEIKEDPDLAESLKDREARKHPSFVKTVNAKVQKHRDRLRKRFISEAEQHLAKLKEHHEKSGTPAEHEVHGHIARIQKQIDLAKRGKTTPVSTPQSKPTTKSPESIQPEQPTTPTVELEKPEQTETTEPEPIQAEPALAEEPRLVSATGEELTPGEFKQQAEAQKEKKRREELTNTHIGNRSELYGMEPEEYRKHMDEYNKELAAIRPTPGTKQYDSQMNRWLRSEGYKKKITPDVRNAYAQDFEKYLDSGASDPHTHDIEYHKDLGKWLSKKGIKPKYETANQKAASELEDKAIAEFQQTHPGFSKEDYQHAAKKAIDWKYPVGEGVRKNYEARKRLMNLLGITQQDIDKGLLNKSVKQDGMEDELGRNFDTWVPLVAGEFPGSHLGSPGEFADIGAYGDTGVGSEEMQKRARQLLQDRSLSRVPERHEKEFHDDVADYIEQHGGPEAIAQARQVDSEEPQQSEYQKLTDLQDNAQQRFSAGKISQQQRDAEIAHIDRKIADHVESLMEDPDLTDKQRQILDILLDMHEGRIDKKRGGVMIADLARQPDEQTGFSNVNNPESTLDLYTAMNEACGSR